MTPEDAIKLLENIKSYINHFRREEISKIQGAIWEWKSFFPIVSEIEAHPVLDKSTVMERIAVKVNKSAAKKKKSKKK